MIFLRKTNRIFWLKQLHLSGCKQYLWFFIPVNNHKEHEQTISKHFTFNLQYLQVIHKINVLAEQIISHHSNRYIDARWNFKTIHNTDNKIWGRIAKKKKWGICRILVTTVLLLIFIRHKSNFRAMLAEK